jgi:hypothetical protein
MSAVATPLCTDIKAAEFAAGQLLLPALARSGSAERVRDAETLALEGRRTLKRTKRLDRTSRR